ncbi:MAG: ribonuclease PH [Bifidobacteriaceae bacterium]|nr:ribonuclease PH [Bifidobacteriaceae bacterium]
MTCGNNTPFERFDGRSPDQLRPVRIERGWQRHAEGSALVEFGDTRVLCAATFSDGVPRWRRGSGEGWLSAEYAMLPRATNDRTDRESVRGRIGGRTHEISRLIGRSLRGITDLKALGESTILVDCDVLQADGGTRTAAITGAYVALAEAIAWARQRGLVSPKRTILTDSVAAVSVGLVDGQALADLAYVEDVRAGCDMNVVATGRGQFIEVQGTAEHGVFDRQQLDQLLDLALQGTSQLAAIQAQCLADLELAAQPAAGDSAGQAG